MENQTFEAMLQVPCVKRDLRVFLAVYKMGRIKLFVKIHSVERRGGLGVKALTVNCNIPGLSPVGDLCCFSFSLSLHFLSAFYCQFSNKGMKGPPKKDSVEG